MIPWFTPWLHYLNFSFKEAYHEVRFEKDSRYYTFRLEKDLLDDWTIIIVNGRIKSKLGQSRILAFSTYANAFGQFLNMIKIRYKRNYLLKTLSSENFISLYYPLLLLISQNIYHRINAKKQEKLKTETIKINLVQKTANQLFLPLIPNEKLVIK
jgi:hypothetical protein